MPWLLVKRIGLLARRHVVARLLTRSYLQAWRFMTWLLTRRHIAWLLARRIVTRSLVTWLVARRIGLLVRRHVVARLLARSDLQTWRLMPWLLTRRHIARLLARSDLQAWRIVAWLLARSDL
jgi:hypothetical protein